MQDKITVNGVPLHEFLNENEPISDDEKRSRLFEQSRDKIFRYHSIKDKYEYTEKNGKVKKLGKFEVNLANYKNEFKKQIEAYNLNKIAVVILMVNAGKKIDVKQAGEIVVNFSKEHNIKVKPTVRHSLRHIFGRLPKMKIGEYIEVFNMGNQKLPNEYLLSMEFADNNTFEQAYKFISRLPYIVPKESIKPLIVEKKELPQKNSISINSLDKIPGITIQGDIHIHIHIHNK